MTLIKTFRPDVLSSSTTRTSERYRSALCLTCTGSYTGSQMGTFHRYMEPWMHGVDSYISMMLY